MMVETPKAIVICFVKGELKPPICSIQTPVTSTEMIRNMTRTMSSKPQAYKQKNTHVKDYVERICKFL